MKVKNKKDYEKIIATAKLEAMEQIKRWGNLLSLLEDEHRKKDDIQKALDIAYRAGGQDAAWQMYRIIEEAWLKIIGVEQGE